MQVVLQAVNGIGEGPTKGSTLDFDVTFPTAFPYAAPIVTATVVITPSYHSSGPFPDAFATNVYNVTKTGFTVRIYRVDSDTGVGWEMPLSLGYVAQAAT